MRTYRQYCGLARALDAVGDRWTLLIVRELLVLGACRYTDLRHGLPGIATNLLVDRLREMEQAGIVERVEASPSVATAHFRLTERGRALSPVIRALGEWAGPTMGPWQAGEEFRSHWLALPLELHLIDGDPSAPPVSIEIRTGDRPLTLATADGAVRVRPGSADMPDAVVAGPPDVVLAALMGRVPLAAARERGFSLEGDARVLDRVRPKAAAGTR
jgi:DNA-binding HxlR family transcriptional regulator